MHNGISIHDIVAINDIEPLQCTCDNIPSPKVEHLPYEEISVNWNHSLSGHPSQKW